MIYIHDMYSLYIITPYSPPLLFLSFVKIGGSLWKIADVLFAQEIIIVSNVVRVRVFLSSLQYNLL